MNYQGSKLKGTLDRKERLKSKKPDYNPLVRRTIETEYILDNLEEAVNSEQYFSEGSLSSIVEKALVYEENGELKKKDEIIKSSQHSDYLDKKAEKLIEKGINGEEQLKNIINSTKETIDNYENKIGVAIKGKEFQVSDSKLQSWILSDDRY